MKIALSPREKLRGFMKFLDVKLNQRPLSLSLEVTKRCNARCDFCDYWKITDRDELTDFTDPDIAAGQVITSPARRNRDVRSDDDSPRCGEWDGCRPDSVVSRLPRKAQYGDDLTLL